MDTIRGKDETMRTAARCDRSRTIAAVLPLALIVPAGYTDGSGEATHTSRWDGRDAAGVRRASGVYSARLFVGGHESTRKILFLR